MNYFILALIINVNFAQKITLSGLSDTLTVYACAPFFPNAAADLRKVKKLH